MQEENARIEPASVVRLNAAQNKLIGHRAMDIAVRGAPDYMLRIMPDPEQNISKRNDMAKAAAPYLH